MTHDKFKKLFLAAFTTLALLALSACSDPQFGAVRGKKQESTPKLKSSSLSMCADYTLVRPPVDLLFLWDNSSSSVFINNQTRQALNQIVQSVSERFDYHIMLAPLLKTGSVNSNVKLVSYDTKGLSSSAMSMRVAKEQAADALNFPTAGGSVEPGLERAHELLINNRSNGIFRNGAYTIVVLMSTQDDNSYVSGDFVSGGQRREHVEDQVHKLLCLRGNYDGQYGGGCSGPNLNSTMMRFISIVANDRNRCSQNGVAQNAKAGVAYEMASSFIYSEGYNNTSPKSYHNDQNGAPLQQRGSDSYRLYDSTDICRGDYSGIFDGVNSVIQDRVVAHKYKYWPIAGYEASVDPDTIRVRRANGQEILPTSDNKSGFKYIGKKTNFNTRIEPSPGEPYTGHLIELFEDEQNDTSDLVIYPDCLRITYSEEKEYYGYVHITDRPLESSIELRINGSKIEPCSNESSCSNGWVFLNTNGKTNRNIKITAPNDYTPNSENPDSRNGYFLKVFGDAVYSNGDNINVNWLPSSN